MANVELPWEVSGIITPEESVRNMIAVIKSKGIQHSGTFWTWENKVLIPSSHLVSMACANGCSPILGNSQFRSPVSTQ
jgi:hypothetical protein